MDLDEYFTVGPGDRFQRNDVFTDRRDYVELFLGRVHRQFARRFSVTEYTDFRRSADNVVVLHGDGGVGKTTLLDRLCEEFRGLESAALPKRRAAVVIDFADTANHTFETVLLRLRAALAGLDSRWLCFDAALASYWERAHPGVQLDAFVRRTKLLDPHLRQQFADQAVGLIDEIVGSMGLISAGVNATTALARALRQAVSLRQAKAEFPPLGVILDEPQPENVLAYLPVLLGWDLERLRRSHGAAAVCMFDTFEAVQILPPERGFLEDLIARTAYLMPNVLFVIAGRRSLRWHDPIRAVGLQYGGETRWPGLAGRDVSDQYPLDGFSDADAHRYLEERLTGPDGQAAIAAEIRQRIIAGSGGSPLYLDLSVSLFRNTVLRGEPVTPAHFGEPLPELVLRIMRDLTAMERDLLRAASLFEAFDADLLSAALPGVRLGAVERFLQRSFVRRHDEAWPRFRLHENLRRSILQCDHFIDDGWVASERAHRLDQAMRRVVDVGLAVWSEEDRDPLATADRSRQAVTAFLLCLHAALEHRVLPVGLDQLAYTVSQLGHWQALAALPQAEGAQPPLRRLVEVARLAGDGGTDAVARYAAATAVAGSAQDHPYDAYVAYELAMLAQVARVDDDGERHFAALESAPAPLSDAAPWGRAGIALRHSRLADALRYAGGTRDRALDTARTRDLFGHIYLQGGDFERAAELFGETLVEGRRAGAPLWVARALRHSALALMWLDPAAARDLLPEARDLNAALADTVGLAQCDLAGSVAAAGTGDFETATRLLAESRQRARDMGTVEPVDLAEALICAVLGERDAALAAARRLVADVHTGRPVIPAWAAVATLWVGLPELWDFTSIGWYDDPDAVRRRWMRPYDRMRALVATP